MSFIVAIDGPAGSGKGTVTKLVAKDLGFVTVDTGAMYRCVTLDCLSNGVNYTELEKIEKILEDIKIELKKDGEKQKVFLNGRDVTEEIRSSKIENNGR